jgi:hypothetical protein
MTKPQAEMVLWYRQLGEKRPDAMPIGSGNFGAMVLPLQSKSPWPWRRQAHPSSSARIQRRNAPDALAR